MYRKEALERLSSPERLDQLVQIVGPKDWLLLSSLVLLFAAVVYWSAWGRLPTIVAGQGVLIRPRKVVEFQSPASGRLVALNVRVGDTVKKGEVLGTIDLAEIRKQLEEEQAKLAEIQAQDREKSALETQQAQLQTQEIEAEKRSYQMQSQNREKSIKDAEALTPLLQKRMEGRRQLKAEGLIPAMSDELMQAEQALLENQSKISDLQAQMKELESQMRRLETREKVIVQQTFESSTARKNEIQGLRSQIALLQVQLEKNSQIISESAGVILEVTANVGQVVGLGSRLGSLEVEDSSSQLVCLSYFPVQDGKRIKTGMKIQVTPDTVKRERFGGILGTVASVSIFPVTKEGAATMVGNPEVVNRLFGEGPQIEVVAELERDPSNFSGYKWSSSKGPQLQMSFGTTASGRVTVEERAPITYVLPFLRSISGIR
ncbi:MAG TPA: NHLP bacteriocin system secretion protein [Terriglobia bacterium]|nr:NHLP bacteriocin system secretion protein [Terriglobia bacterium]